MLCRVIDFRKIRLFLEQRQLDVSLATGVSIPKIAAAERGDYVHPHDLGILERYYAAQLRDECEHSRNSRISPDLTTLANRLASLGKSEMPRE